MQTGNTSYIYKNHLDKACFQHDVAYGRYKDLTKREESDKVLRDKAFQIASNTSKIDLFSKYAWFVPLKDKKGVIIVNASQSTLNNSKRKPNKVWVNHSSKFCNNSFKEWLKGNNIEM